MVNAENFCEFCSIFSFQPCYAKFSNSLVQYLATFQSIEQFIATMKYKKFKNLLQVLTDSSFLSEREKCNIKSKKAHDGKTKFVVRKQAFIDTLKEKYLNNYSELIECLEKDKSFHYIALNILKIEKELCKTLTCYRASIATQMTTSCAHKYRENLIDVYNKLHVTSMQGWYDEQNSNFIEVTIERTVYVQKTEPIIYSTTSPNKVIQYTRQCSAAEPHDSIREIFQFGGSKKGELILIEGNVGTGKTTLSHKVCQEWASNNMLQEFTHVVLVHLRDQKPDNIHSEKDLFASMGDNAPATQKALADCDSKNKVLFWLDGWDEIHDSYKKDSVFTRLLTGDSFPRATVVVTTRPSATISLKSYKFSHRFKIKGFSESQIKAFVDKYFSEGLCDELLSELFMQQLHSVHSLPQLAEVPLNLSILLKLFYEQHRLPKTSTEIYHNIVLVVLQYHKEKAYDDHTPIKLWDDFNLPKEMREILHGLEKYAYDCFLKKKPISQESMLAYMKDFQVEQLQNFNGMGLLEIKKVKCITGDSKCYQYRYKVIQEFLAAIYLSRLDPSIQTEELKEIFGDMNYEMVWVFYAGITGLKRVSIQDLLPKLDRPVQPTSSVLVNAHEKLVENWHQCYAHFKSMTEHGENHMEFLLTLILCCYEAQNTEACNLVADYYYSSNICHIEIPPNHANPYFLLAISYFITHSGKKWSLRCDDIIQSGFEFLKYSQGERSPALQSESTSGLWVLCFVVKSSEVEIFIELMKMHLSLQWINLLHRSQLGDDGIEKLCNYLASDDCNIIKIELEHCGIGSVGLKSVTNLLKINSRLLYISLRKNSFSPEDIKTLLLNIKQNKFLEYLILDEQFLKNPEINYILQSINGMRRNKKAKLLSITDNFLSNYNTHYHTPKHTQV